MILNITNRQMCEKIYDNSIQRIPEIQGRIQLLTDFLIDSTDIDFSELVDSGILGSNGSWHDLTIVGCPVISGSDQISTKMSIELTDRVYDDTEPITIMEYVNFIKPDATTISEVFGTPIAEKVHDAGYTTILGYARANYAWSDGYTAATLTCKKGDSSFPIARIIVNMNTKQVTVIRFSLDDDSTSEIESILDSLGCSLEGFNMLSDITSTLADGVYSIADLSGVLNRYISSPFGNISEFARQILRQGSNSAETTINRIISLFRSSQSNYVENDDGTITWNIQSNGIVDTWWMVLTNVAITATEIVGTALLLCGTVVAKVVGFTLTLFGSVFKNIVNTAGQVAGTTPIITDTAIDHCYHDPIAQGHETDLPVWEINAGLIKVLREFQKAKIVTSLFVLYIYNVTISGGRFYSFDWKLFPGMDSKVPALNVNAETTSGYPMPGNAKQTCVSGFVNFWIQNVHSAATNKGYSFSVGCNNSTKIGFNPNTGMAYPIAVENDDLASFRDELIASANANPVDSLAANSLDAADYVTMWQVLRSNTIASLSLVFCNPLFYDSGQSTISSSDTSVYDLRPLFYYNNYTGASGYTNVINAVANLAKINHDNDKFCRALLNTLGLFNPSNTFSPYLNDIGVTYVNQTDDVVLSFETISGNFDADIHSSFNDEATGIFSFLSVDPYSYVTPPTYNYKSIIFAAIITAIITVTIVVAAKVLQKKLTRRARFRMTVKGQQLMTQGKYYTGAITDGTYANMTKEEQKQFYSDWVKYDKSVNRYNFVANLLGMSSIDYQNNWWNAYQKQGSTINASTGEILTKSFADNMAVSSDKLNSRIDQTDAQVSNVKSINEDIYFAITGIHPSGN